MNKLTLLAGAITLSLAVAGTASGQARPDRDAAVERELRDLDRQWAELAVRGNVAAFDRLTANDLVATHASGNLVRKADEKKYIAESPRRLAAITTDDVDVRLYGDTAVILGRVTVKSKKGRENEYRYTTVWKKTDRWRVIAEQHTRIEPPAPPPAPGKGKSPEQVVREYAKACNELDLAAFVALHSPDVRKLKRADESGKLAAGKKPGDFIVTTSGRDEVKRKYERVFAATPPSVHVEIVSLFALGDLVVSRDRVTGFPDGHVTDELTLYQIEDGLVRTIWYLERTIR